MSTWGSYFSLGKKKPAVDTTAATATATDPIQPKIETASKIPEKSEITKVDLSAFGIPSPVLADANTNTNADTTAIGDTLPKPLAIRKATDGFQRANSSAKKLYEIPVTVPKEVIPVIKDGLTGAGPPKAASSNASRVAKMFGYAANAYTAPPVTSQAETKRKPPPLSPLLLLPDKGTGGKGNGAGSTPPLSPLMAMVQAAAETKARKSPPLSPFLMLPEGGGGAGKFGAGAGRESPPSPLLLVPEGGKGGKFGAGAGMDPPLSPIMAMVQAAAEPKVMPVVDAVLKYKKDNKVVERKSKSKKDEVQDMLDFFASQLEAPVDVLALPSDKKMDTVKPTVEESRKKEKTVEPFVKAAPAFEERRKEEKITEPAVKAKPIVEERKREEKITEPVVKAKQNAMDMLDFFSSQLDSTDDMFALPEEKPKAVPKPARKAKQSSIDMLDFFSSQLDSADDMFALPGDKNLQNPKTVTEEPPQPQTVKPDNLSYDISPLNFSTQKSSSIPPVTRKDSGWSSQGSNTSQELKSIMSSPRSKIWSRQTSSTSSELSSVMSGRKDSLWSQQGSPMSSTRAMSIKNRTSLIEQDVVQIRGRILAYGEDDEQMKAEQKRRDTEHERIVELQEQAMMIIQEREEMEAERLRMLEEQLMFETEAARIQEEEESMRKFVENVERERILDAANQEKKRKRREEEEKARWEAEMAEQRRREEEEEAERRRIQAEEQKRREEEEAERRRVQAEEQKRREEDEEMERRRMQAQEQEKREAELAAKREAERAAREMDKERSRVADLERKKRLRLEEDRLAKEEADRLTAEMMKYQDQQEAERRYLQEEEERKRDIARQKKLDRQEYEEKEERKREAEEKRRLVAKEHQEQDERVRKAGEAAAKARAIEQEKFEMEQRRAAERKADRLFKEEQERSLFAQQNSRSYGQQQADPRYRQEGARRYQQDQAGRNQQQPAGRYQQDPAGQYQQDQAGRNQQQPAGQYQQEQAGRYQQEQAGRNQQQPAGRYQQEQAGPYQQRNAEATKAAGADRLANDYLSNLNIPGNPMLSPSIYGDENFQPEEEEREETKEEKLAKAEEKIRMAFAGLAEERSQPIPTAATVVIPRSNTVRDDRGPGGYGGFGMQPSANGRQDAGVSRYNTTGGGAVKMQQRREPQLPQMMPARMNTVAGRNGGLPTGPRAGGLPGGPRMARR
ncbi:hypothetical protein VTL71DRAFT_9844 [Oculimacula yallundae]|uniref:Uncharacterized protein n=1 Tax=Oculimacula yallundae TaxID=86028 RepID=A0ABR4BQN1_9HELO